MANKTVKDAKTIHGTNPQYLVEKIIRTRIYESRYWKEECFGLTADLIVDKGSELRYIGGIYGGNIKPSPFLCLTLKLLQIQPDKDIVIEFIRQENFKYIRALGAFYLRLVTNSLDIYKYLEPLYNDFRKLRRMTQMGTFDIVYMDEFVDMLLRDERVFDIIMPRLTKRFIHVDNGELPKRVSLIDEDLIVEDDKDADEDDRKSNSDNDIAKKPNYNSDDDSRIPQRLRNSRSPDRHRRHNEGLRDRYYDDESSSKRYKEHRSRRSNSRERHRHRDRNERRRSRSHSPDRHRSSKKSKHRDDKSKRTTDRDVPGKPSSEQDEIAQMNALRASLGLKPLKL